MPRQRCPMAVPDLRDESCLGQDADQIGIGRARRTVEIPEVLERRVPARQWVPDGDLDHDRQPGVLGERGCERNGLGDVEEHVVADDDIGDRSHRRHVGPTPVEYLPRQRRGSGRRPRTPRASTGWRRSRSTSRPVGRAPPTNGHRRNRRRARPHRAPAELRGRRWPTGRRGRACRRPRTSPRRGSTARSAPGPGSRPGCAIHRAAPTSGRRHSSVITDCRGFGSCGSVRGSAIPRHNRG